MTDYAKKKIPFSTLRANLKAVLALPLIFTEKYPDPWNQFAHYLEIEQGTPSTFFFIPFKNRPGEGYQKNKQTYRAAKYDVNDVSEIVKMLQAHGREVGVHGIDAWHSTEKGRQERNRVAQITGADKVGIRMHWLCRNSDTFTALDQAGYDYDSSFGFNDAVGFRAGTAQVFKPLGTKHLLELPLHIQDTALFNPSRMNLRTDDARRYCNEILSHVAGKNGGVITILWHQRSIGPERLWGDFYVWLLAELCREQCWFASARDCVAWFRARRTVKFTPDGDVIVSDQPERGSDMPKFMLRTYNTGKTTTDHLFNLPT